LYFLLSDSPTSLNEDDDRFRLFFDKRYATLARGVDTPIVIKETKRWLTEQVFVKRDEEMQEIDEEQQVFEEELQLAILGEKDADRDRRAFAAGAFRGDVDEEDQ
jgi:hypothetical protein